MDEPYHRILEDWRVARDNIEARILLLKAAHYVLYDDNLYRRGYFMPLLKCVTLLDAKCIMREIHESTYENSEGQSLVFTALR